MSEDPPVPSLDVDAAETVSFRYEMDEDEPPTHALVAVTSAVTGAAPTELDPFGRHLDLEALDALLGSTDGDPAFSVSITLEADELSLGIGDEEIVGVASRDVAEGAPDWS